MTTPNVFQIDVEPWYCDLPRERWGSFDDRVPRYTREILDLLDETDNRATFFVLRDVARRYPELVGAIGDAGHEVATHGTRHTHLSELDRAAFVESLTASIEALSDVGIDPVGYRAPQFSLDHRSSFVVPELIERGFSYDSSVFPVRTPLYGLPDAPRTPYRIDRRLVHETDSPLWEVPLAAYRVPGVGVPVPVAGGFYLRAFPYPLFRRLLRRVPAPRVCYVHPWELHTDPTVLDEYPWFQYVGRSSTRPKLRRLLDDFSFTSTRRYVERYADS